MASASEQPVTFITYPTPFVIGDAEPYKNLLRRVVQFAFGCKFDGFAGLGFVLTGRKCSVTGYIGSNYRFINTFYLVKNLNFFGQQMKSITDDTDHQIVVGQLRPERIVVPVYHVGTAVSEVGGISGHRFQLPNRVVLYLHCDDQLQLQFLSLCIF
jgi:hypothetical protein